MAALASDTGLLGETKFQGRLVGLVGLVGPAHNANAGTLGRTAVNVLA